jgi:hypothetical protein
MRLATLALASLLAGCSMFTDWDGDKVDNDLDNCPSDYNPDQADIDGDGIGDVCDDIDDRPTPDDTATPDDTGIETIETWCYDGDGDGYGDPADSQTVEGQHYVLDCTDCNDSDPAINPAVEESCNGVDDDCDSEIDEEVLVTYYADLDGDGYGGELQTTTACELPDGYTITPTDCNDSDPRMNPGMAEVCDGLDNDCNGFVDDNAVDAPTYYADLDGDGYGYGDSGSTVSACAMPSGYVANDEDCDDFDANVYPGASEYCDSIDTDCNGVIDDNYAENATVWYADEDADGYGIATVTATACVAPEAYTGVVGDCDDTDASVFPGASEYCDGVDNNCDGTVDEAAALDALIWYEDRDVDGYGDDAMSTTACNEPSGYVAVGGDCDDTNAWFYPGADESDCTDPNDYNCDGSVGYADLDSDGFAACEECDDSDAATFPGATEICDGADNDCDGTIDEGAEDAPTWYLDRDNDGYGDNAYPIDGLCEAPAGYVSDATDCDDSRPRVNPAVSEYCNGLDDDCDGTVDEDDAIDASAWFADRDTDGYGNVAVSDIACNRPTGFVSDWTDCDDTDSSVYPGAPEHCDGMDEDCDGTPDNGVVWGYWYPDMDGDGYGDTGATATYSCSIVSGAVTNGNDCDDTNAAINPGATEYCDGVDDDCDGIVDDDCAFLDTDLDGYSEAIDCDDTNPDVHPDAEEVCDDGLDNDCDGIELDCDDVDNDGDGQTENEGDCDDANPAIYSGAAENCGNGYDDNCDGDVDYNDDDCRGYLDLDLDGYTGATDCDDADTSINPGATDVCDNGIDEDCSGSDLVCADVDIDLDGYPAATDCDETDASIHPDAEEVCGDGVDQDCDGVDTECPPEEPGPAMDMDGDGYSTADGFDCDDTDATVYPGATEDANGIDDDCDGIIDEGTDLFDDDGDGYSEAAGDCDDADPNIYPGAYEYCDGVDNDCDGTVDEAAALDALTWYADMDSDGFGDLFESAPACTQPVGYSIGFDDCDDTDSSVHPYATEYCNGADDDCDGDVDEGIAMAIWYTDVDSDGYGDDSTAFTSCLYEAGMVLVGGDCDDAETDIHPWAEEVCDDGVDQDCDGTDEACPPAPAPGTDADGDGWTVEGGDCDDGNPLINPLALDACESGVDEDCDGIVDDSACASNVDCTMDTDGLTLVVTINGNISGSLQMPLAGTITTVGLEGYTSGGHFTVAYQGDWLSHSLLVYPDTRFMVYAVDDAMTMQYAVPEMYSTSGLCSRVEDGLGGYVFVSSSGT